jgi:hypothetical protein
MRCGWCEQGPSQHVSAELFRGCGPMMLSVAPGLPTLILVILIPQPAKAK